MELFPQNCRRSPISFTKTGHLLPIGTLNETS
jgi:hypothetical protein